MTEGTRSYIFGCHNFLIHPFFVFMAWRLEYQAFPKWWELICILLHDIGVCGRQYLSDDKAKIGHWERGAQLASDLVERLTRDMSKGNLAYNICAGHTHESGFPLSKLYRADKRSWIVAPTLWLWSNY